MSEDKFCCRCKEDFPVATFQGPHEPIRMGYLYLLKHMKKKIQKMPEIREWVHSEIHGDGYLCGNCYFDLTD